MMKHKNTSLILGVVYDQEFLKFISFCSDYQVICIKVYCVLGLSALVDYVS